MSNLWIKIELNEYEMKYRKNLMEIMNLKIILIRMLAGSNKLELSKEKSCG